MAAIAALQLIKGENHEIEIVSDSKYLTEAFNKRWINDWMRRKWKNVKNPDLWKLLLGLTKNHQMRWTWIKGHNLHPENERCDQLAKDAASGMHLLDDQGYIASKVDTMD